MGVSLLPLLAAVLKTKLWACTEAKYVQTLQTNGQGFGPLALTRCVILHMGLNQQIRLYLSLLSVFSVHKIYTGQIMEFICLYMVTKFSVFGCLLSRVPVELEWPCPNPTGRFLCRCCFVQSGCCFFFLI